MCFEPSSIKHGVGCDCSACMVKRSDIEHYVVDPVTNQWVLRQSSVTPADAFWLSTAPAKSTPLR